MKLSIAFLTGVLAMAAVVYSTGAHFAAPMFFAGVVAVVAPGIAYLSSIKRIRTAARFLYSFADAWDGTLIPRAVVKDHLTTVAVRSAEASGYRKPSRRQAEQITRDSVAEYLGNDVDEIFGVSPSRRAS
jgi:biotin transporter BioY